MEKADQDEMQDIPKSFRDYYAWFRTQTSMKTPGYTTFCQKLKACLTDNGLYQSNEPLTIATAHRLLRLCHIPVEDLVNDDSITIEELNLSPFVFRMMRPEIMQTIVAEYADRKGISVQAAFQEIADGHKKKTYKPFFTMVIPECRGELGRCTAFLALAPTKKIKQCIANGKK